MSFTIGSLFDGSGGFPLAATMCGGTPKWASEIEPYPIAVTKSRFPGVKHLGSVTDIKGGEVEPVDVITFGSPCQDLSVAGKRAGLKHTDNGDDETTRSGLFMEAVRIIKEMREATNGVYPRFAVWENVPGAFSSNKGEDFRIVLQELIQIVEPSAVMPEVPEKGWPYADSYCGDGWSLAYRVLDAQYWGVPQRRRRIYLVADFRGECAGKVSFEREGLRGYFETGRTPWQTVAGDAETCSGAADCERAVGFLRQLSGVEAQEEVSPTLMAAAGMSGNNKPCVAYSFDALSSNSMKSSNPHSGCRQVEIAKCLDTTDPNPSKNQGGIAIVEQVPYTLKIRSGCEGGGKGALIQEDLSATLATNNDQYLFQPVYSIENHPADSRVNIDDSGKVQTLTSRMGTGGGNVPMVMESYLDVEMEVAVRKYEVDCKLLCECLRDHKHGSNFSNKDIAEALDVPITQVEHWFRQDKYFAIPEPEVWPKLKNLLGIETDEFDQSIMTFEFKGGNYDMRNRIYTGDVAPTLTCGCGNDLHLLPHNPVFCLQGNAIDRADTAGCNGKGVKEDVCYTLNTIDRPAVAFRTYQKVTGPLMANSHPGSYTGQDAFSDMLVAGVDARNATEYPEMTGALQADAAHNLNSNNVVRIQYIVRRLTPTECARLQGFPDTWGHPIQKTELTDEEYQFWLNVRNTHAAINDKATKEYTKDQILKWYNGLHTDSSEYKMWGNGIALPNALYVMQGIADVMSEEKETRRKWLNDLLGDCL